MFKIRHVFVVFVAFLFVICGSFEAVGTERYLRTNELKESGVSEFKSDYFAKNLIFYSGVFNPWEAERRILPFMKRMQKDFRDKVVLDIGGGSGVIGLYAAQLGAKKVVLTDINPNAILSINENAERLGLSKIVEARLVPSDDASAYSVIEENERFDIIISNPPYSLDLDARASTNLKDNGELGFSIVRGLPNYLKPQGKAILFYSSFFYHHVIVKFAKFLGYFVSQSDPVFISSWEADVLFNSYLTKVLEKEKLPKDAFSFNMEQDMPNNAYIKIDTPSSKTMDAGFIVIRLNEE